MKVGVPDWAGIRADTRRAFVSYWPLLLAVAAIDVAVSVSGVLVVSREEAQASGLTGYLAYLKLTAWEFLPMAIASSPAKPTIVNTPTEAMPPAA